MQFQFPFTLRTGIIIGSVILVLLVAAPSIYFFNKYRQTQQLLAKNPLPTEQEKQAIIEKVGKLIDLPKDEDPTVATVSDREQLRNQPFFAKAKNGDKLLIYNTAKKAILYDPVADKILEVGPLIVPSSAPGGEAQAIITSAPDGLTEPTRATTPTNIPLSTTPTPIVAARNVVLANGTSINGLTYLVEQTLNSFEGQYKVIRKKNAAKRDYSKTIVVDVSGSKTEEAQLLATRIDGSVEALPEGEEQPPDGDFLIIVGEDQK